MSRMQRRKKNRKRKKIECHLPHHFHFLVGIRTPTHLPRSEHCSFARKERIRQTKRKTFLLRFFGCRHFSRLCDCVSVILRCTNYITPKLVGHLKRDKNKTNTIDGARITQEKGEKRNVLNIPMGHPDPNSLRWCHQPIATLMAIPDPAAIALALAYVVLMALDEHTIVPIVGNLCWRLISFFRIFIFYFFRARLQVGIFWSIQLLCFSENTDTCAALLLPQPQKCYSSKAKRRRYLLTGNTIKTQTLTVPYFPIDGVSVNGFVNRTDLWMSIAYCMTL